MSLAVQEAELEISRSAIRVGIGQIVAGVLQTLVIAGGLLFMRSESRAREHARRYEETMAAMQERHEETMTALKEERDARRAQHEAMMTALNPNLHVHAPLRLLA